eukprot:2649021-Alexandrium_andersonii.AAC.1
MGRAQREEQRSAHVFAQGPAGVANGRVGEWGGWRACEPSSERLSAGVGERATDRAIERISVQVGGPSGQAIW